MATVAYKLCTVMLQVLEMQNKSARTSLSQSCNFFYYLPASNCEQKIFNEPRFDSTTYKL